MRAAWRVATPATAAAHGGEMAAALSAVLSTGGHGWAAFLAAAQAAGEFAARLAGAAAAPGPAVGAAAPSAAAGALPAGAGAWLSGLARGLAVASRDTSVSQVRAQVVDAMHAVVAAAAAAPPAGALGGTGGTVLDAAAVGALRQHVQLLLETEKSAAIKAEALKLRGSLPAAAEDVEMAAA